MITHQIEDFINWAGFSFVTTERGMDIIFQSFHLIKVTRSWKCWTLKKTRKIFLLYVKKHGNISLYNKIFKQNEWMLIGCQEIWLLWHPLDMSAFMTSSDSCLSKILHRMMCAPICHFYPEQDSALRRIIVWIRR